MYRFVEDLQSEVRRMEISSPYCGLRQVLYALREVAILVVSDFTMVGKSDLMQCHVTVM